MISEYFGRISTSIPYRHVVHITWFKALRCPFRTLNQFTWEMTIIAFLVKKKHGKP